MPTTVQQLLKDHGPSTSSQLAAHLIGEGVSPEAARQRISRAKAPVKRLSSPRLPKRQQFLYLAEQRDTSEFIDALSEALLSTGSAHGRFLRGLLVHGGIVRASYGPVVTGLPVEPARNNRIYNDILSELKFLRLVKEVERPSGVYLELSTAGVSVQRYFALEVVQNIILAGIKGWLVRLNFSSNNKLETRDLNKSLPQIGQFRFDFAGPSYISSLKRSPESNGFIVGDVIVGRELCKEDLKPFLWKVDALYAQRRANPVQAMLVAEGYESDALNELRRRGVILAGPTSVFGPELGNDIRTLVRTLENAAAVVAKDPKELYDLLARLQKIEGVALNLRGIVIELAVAYLYQNQGYVTDIRQQVVCQDGLAEIDVKAKSKTEIVCCECKGMSPKNLVSRDEIEKWLSGPVKRIKQWFCDSNESPNVIRFEFYSSTGFTEDARELINHVEETHKKQPIRFFDGKEIITVLRERREQKLAELFKEQFGF